MLYREPKVLKLVGHARQRCVIDAVSVLYREPKVLKPVLRTNIIEHRLQVSVLYREPKVLKRVRSQPVDRDKYTRFSALP